MTLLELFQLLRKHIKLLVVLPIVCTVAMAGVSFFMMENTYTASTSMYILARESSAGGSTSYTDLSASQMLANDVATLLQSDVVQDGSAKKLGLKSLNGYKVSVSSETTSRVITLSVTGKDAEGVARVANAIAEEVSEVAQNVQMAQSVNVIDRADAPTSPSGPNRTLYVAVAFLAGLFAAVAIIVLIDMLNTRVRSSEDAEDLLGISVIGRIPVLKDGR